MGAGKTTIGSLLDPAFADMDELLVQRLEMPISDYFSRYGEDSFRQQESLLLHELLNQESSVISTAPIKTLAGLWLKTKKPRRAPIIVIMMVKIANSPLTKAIIP